MNIHAMLFRLPLALRVPLLTGIIVFATATGSTHVALWIENREADEQLKRMAQVHLDGVAAAARASLAAGDAQAVVGQFERLFHEQSGVRERLIAGFGPDGRLVARVGDATLPEEKLRHAEADHVEIDFDQGVAWASRRLSTEDGTRIVAALDLREIIAARDRLSVAVILVDLGLALACAVLAYAATRRLSRPVDAILAHLSAAAVRQPEPLPDTALERVDDRTAEVLRAYNRMADAQRERHRLAAALAEREQLAALGRLAATLAHEVRNPLSGLATTVSTLRKFGADPKVREESLAFLDRGIDTIGNIVTSTLNLYRPEEERRLSRADFEDLALLVRPAAANRNVVLDWRVDLPDEVALGATGVRQVLLNLLLNACAATPAGGGVTLDARVEDDNLVCTIADQGPGLTDERAGRLSGTAAAALPEPTSKRLGMDIVVGLLQGLDGRAVAVSEPDRGTSVRVSIPLQASA